MKIEKVFALSKMKVTKPRLIVYKIFQDASKPLTVKEIRNQIPKNINKATVYRIIEKYVEIGLLKEYFFHEDAKRYELMGNPHHHHLICTKCFQIINLDPDELEDVINISQKGISSRYKYTIQAHALEFYGICPKCTQKR